MHSSQIWLYWCPRSQRIRTAAEIGFEVDLADVEQPPCYQVIATKALHLRRLGMSFPQIGRALGVTHTTAAKAVRWALREWVGSDQAPAFSRC